MHKVEAANPGWIKLTRPESIVYIPIAKISSIATDGPDTHIYAGDDDTYYACWGPIEDVVDAVQEATP